MPTDAEVTAAAIALHDMLGDDHTMRGCLHMAGKALAAAEAVRVKANECHALDRNHVGLCECPICRAYRAGRSDAAFIAANAPDQRMTQTHAPLGGITATEQAARAAVLADARQREADEAGRRDTAGQAAALRAAEADANYRATLTGGQTHPSTQPPPSQVAPTPATHYHGRDYHTSGVPGDGWMLVERTIAHD